MNTIDGRCEYKFPLTPEDRIFLEKRISEMLSLDSHGANYTISSLYFDDAAHRLYYMTHDREPYRYKLRLRIYGNNPDGSAISFFEVKSKLLGRSTKRRLALPLEANERLYRERILPDGLSSEDEKLARYILYQIERDRLEPAAIVSYERLAFVGNGDDRIRATFDSALRIRVDDLDLKLGSHGTPIMKPGECVLELKSGANLPRELTSLLHERGLSNRSYSKYGKTDFINHKGDNSSWATLSAGSSRTSKL